MALALANRVQETSTTTGTGTLTLAGAVAGFRTFAAGIGSGNTCYYAITSTTGDWEVGVGTVGTGTLARTTLLSSSTGSLVSFTGTLNVFVTYPSEKSVNLDASNVITGYPITVKDNAFTLQDDVDPTKQAVFQLSGLTTGTTFTYTLTAQTGTIPVLGSINSWTGNNVFANVNGTFGSSAGAGTINVASGATTTGLTKTVNVGTGGLSGSTTNITLGSTFGTITNLLGILQLAGSAGTSGQVLTSAGASTPPTWATPVSSNITAQGLFENANTISANYTIGTGNNAVSAGPITINSGIVVTVPSGSTWVVV